MPSAFTDFFERSTAIDHLLVRFSGASTTHRDELATLLGLQAPDSSDDPETFAKAALSQLAKFRTEFRDSILSFTQISRSSQSTSTVLKHFRFTADDESSLKTLQSRMGALRQKFSLWFPPQSIAVTTDPSCIQLRFLLNSDGVRILKDYLDIQEQVHAFLLRVAASREAAAKSTRSQSLITTVQELPNSTAF
ncbi:MAG: hypothetical protein VXU42_07000, partial [Verrucomicrobiota bacterium]|nr:hypothetical protein [Verrucomicrobiota bacterium]